MDNDRIAEDGAAAEDGRPSKSERKRAASAAQDLGERLIALPDAELAALPLPERLLEAIRTARAIRARSSGARQRQFIGKLMRNVDPQPILDLLADEARSRARKTERFRAIEIWRDRLVAEGDSALAALGEARSLSPAQHAALMALLQRARDTTGNRRTAAARELFRALRTLFAAT
jgi:ribosome-associated protein